MGWPSAKRRLVLYVTLLGCGLAVCAWQVEEHVRFRRSAEQTLINRGRDITSTLGVVLRSQRRFAGVVSKDRLQSALQDLIRPEELESIAILGSTGEAVASAGAHVDLTPDMLEARGVVWGDQTLTILNLMDLDASAGDDGAPPRPPIIITDERTARAFRPPSNRRPPDQKPGGDAGTPVPTSTSTSTPTGAATPATGTAAPAVSPAPTVVSAAPGPSGTDATNSTPPPPNTRAPFGRPPWMSRDEYNSIIQKQGVHSLVISLSTVDMHRAVNADLLLRSLVSLLALGAALVSALAWRNVGKNAELQIRLVKAGEMNTHLKEMNLAAAGLAHETRNPLNLIRGLAQMIAMQAKDAPKLVDHASAIMEEADRVTVQLNEFINYSKPREAHLGPVEITRLVADVLRTLLPDIEEKHITVQQPTAPLTIFADEPLLRQALFNVLLNAVQSVAPDGKVEVRVAQTGPREAMLEIRDDGPGVPAAERASIFKPYVTMRTDGVGLGLAIVQQIVAAHHWEIVCEANEPKGACFRFRHLTIVAPVA